MRSEFGKQAKTDLKNIWNYSFETWGEKQADLYIDQIFNCLTAIIARDAHVRIFDEISKDISYHHCQHHFIFFTNSGGKVLVFRVLHEKQEFIRHLEDLFS